MRDDGLKGCEVVLEEGKILYSFRTLRKIVERLVWTVEGVGSFEKSQKESIRIDAHKDLLSLNLFLVFTLERRVPETAWELQRKIKETIERDTLLKIEQINIYVQGFETKRAPLALQGVSGT